MIDLDQLRERCEFHDHFAEVGIEDFDAMSLEIEQLRADLAELRQTADAIFDLDVKHDWRILTNDAAERFVALQQLLARLKGHP